MFGAKLKGADVVVGDDEPAKFSTGFGSLEPPLVMELDDETLAEEGVAIERR
jgi:hypothetical protein